MSFVACPAIIDTILLATESETHRRPRQVGEFHEKIEVQKPAHCVK